MKFMELCSNVFFWKSRDPDKNGPDPQPWLGPKRTTVVVRIRIQIIMNEKSLYIKSEYLTVKSERLID